MKPFLKWAGNKYKIIDRILATLPKGQRLIEPFAGSGSVFLNTDFDAYLIADTNADLINLFKEIQHHGDEFINYAATFFTPGGFNFEVQPPVLVWCSLIPPR
ncbi:MAG: DNA adenine methylase, partial [Gallionella sp.]